MKNGVMMQYFEWNLPNDGRLWTQLKEDASHLAEIGITAVWIPPAYKADEQADEGYATYDLYDLGEFDQKGTVRTKYGTRRELEEMIAALHDNGISVYLDVVLNHKAGGDYKECFRVIEVDGSDRNQDIGEPFEIESYTGYDFKGRADKYSDFKWHWYHFSGTDYDASSDRNGVFRILGDGKGWSQGVDSENGNYDFLMCNDIDLDSPEVVEELINWGRWVSGTFGFDGFRMDAIKHMDYNFTARFLQSVREERGDEFYAVGEYWNGDLEALDEFIENVNHGIDLFDVPLHYNMYQASCEGSGFDMSMMLNDTLVDHHCNLAVTFVENHDSQSGSSLESRVGDWFKPLAYGMILLMKDGYPCIFYGDYYSTDREASPHRSIIDTLLWARRKHAYGDQENYFDHPSTVGFRRTGDEQHAGLVFLMSNDMDGSKWVTMGAGHAGETWREATGSIDTTVTLDDNGAGEFTVRGRNLAVWVRQ